MSWRRPLTGGVGTGQQTEKEGGESSHTSFHTGFTQFLMTLVLFFTPRRDAKGNWRDVSHHYTFHQVRVTSKTCSAEHPPKTTLPSQSSPETPPGCSRPHGFTLSSGVEKQQPHQIDIFKGTQADLS